jgi:hypothetical protein
MTDLTHRIQCLDCGAFGPIPLHHKSDCKPADFLPGRWCKEDPRLHTDKQRIIIVSNGRLSFTAHVDTKHSWSISLDECMDGRTFVPQADKWPESWAWTDIPDTQQEQKAG